MKRFTTFILAITLPIVTIAQPEALDNIFDKYEGQEGYTTIIITKYMFQLFSKIADDEDDSDFKDIVSGLNSIKMLVVDEDEHDPAAFYKEASNALPKSIYKELMIIKDGKEKVTFLINEKNDKISELVMIIGGDDEALLMRLDGDIDLHKIAKLSKAMDIKGLEKLDTIKER